jgi:hypothetical protein
MVYFYSQDSGRVTNCDEIPSRVHYLKIRKKIPHMHVV